MKNLLKLKMLFLLLPLVIVFSCTKDDKDDSNNGSGSYSPGTVGAPGTETVFAKDFTLLVGIEFDNDGNLLVTDYGTSELIKISATGVKSVIAKIESIADVVVDENNVIYALSEKGRIYKIENGKDTVFFAYVKPEGYTSPRDITYDKENKIFYVMRDGSIFKISKQGVVNSFAITPYSTPPAIEYNSVTKKLYAPGASLYEYSADATLKTINYTGNIYIVKGLTHDASGKMFGGMGSKVIKVDVTAGTFEEYVTCSPTGGKWDMVRDIAIKDGHIYVSFGTVIYKY